jgi:hypothetical protein
MAHAESLRVIGQLLEAAEVPAFELEEDGLNYVVKCNSLTHLDELVLNHALIRNDFPDQPTRQSTVSPISTVPSVRLSRADIFRLDDKAQLQRRRTSSQPKVSGTLSQQLRTLGNHLDRMNARAFQICWGSDSVAVYFRRLDGQRDSITFTRDKLERMSTSSRFRRSSLDFPSPPRLRNR